MTSENVENDVKIFGILCVVVVVALVVYMLITISNNITAEHRHSAQVCTEHGGAWIDLKCVYTGREGR